MRALYHWLATRGCDDPLDHLRFRAWKSLSYHNDAALSKDIANQLFPSPLPASVTRVECFAACSFKHFAQFGLSLRPREDCDVTNMDLGNVYHRILERFVVECLRQRRDWCDIEPHVTRDKIRDYADEVARSLRGELLISSARNQYLLKRVQKTLEQVVATQHEVLKRGSFRPAYAELTFGRGGELPPYQLKTPAGREIHLTGKIDRVDIIENAAAFAVIDYKLAGKALQLHHVYHGLSLQLLTYLLVLQNSGEHLGGKKLTPVAAFYSKLLRSLESVEHPDDADAPDDPKFHLRAKPRGIFNGDYINNLDSQLTSGASDVVNAHIRLDDEFGRRNGTDVATPHEFSAVLRFVERKIAQLADQIIDGDVSVRPYRIGGRYSPCSNCDYRSVCRFDVAINRYNPLRNMKRGEVLDEILREDAGAR